MKHKHQLLIAARAEACAELRPFLEPVGALHHAKSMEEALRAMATFGIDIVVCSLGFDESRMFDFLQAAKIQDPASGIPIICCHVVKTILPARLIAGAAKTSRACGAADFVDLVGMNSREAGTLLRRVVKASLRHQIHGRSEQSATSL